VGSMCTCGLSLVVVPFLVPLLFILPLFCLWMEREKYQVAFIHSWEYRGTSLHNAVALQWH
jgi:hypothetical protein